MNNQVTITTTIESSDIEKMFAAYKIFLGDESLTNDDFFNFLTLPTAEREVFLQDFCTCDYEVKGNIVSTNYKVK